MRNQGKRESSAKFDTSSPVKPYTSENGQLQPILVLECRGLELTGFDPRVCRLDQSPPSVLLTSYHLQGIWKCEGAESGTKFDEVDLVDGEWNDYDEKVGLITLRKRI